MSKRFIEYSSGLLKSKFLCSVKRDVKYEMFNSLLGINAYEFEEQAASGDYISSFTNDITIIEQQYFRNVVGLISNMISIVVLVTSFLTLNRILALSIIGFAVITIFIPMAFAQMLSDKNLKYSKKIAEFTQKLKEYFMAYSMIKNYAVEMQIEEKFKIYNEETEEAKFDAEYALVLANSIGSLLSWFMQFIAIGIGLALMAKGKILVGTVIAARSFASDLASPLQEILVNVNSICSVKGIVGKICRYIKREYKPVVADEKSDSKICSVSVTFEDVSLCLSGMPIIDHFSFTFQSGKKYLIIGKNGSGKSSIFKILKKFQSGYTGNIRINDILLADMDNAVLSKYVSYLNENVSLLSGVIKDNILLYRQYSEEDLRNAINKARINIDVNRIISESGNNVSSGEKRRIEIARSLLAFTPVIIFDEVVSTLDIENAYEIEKMALGYDNTIIFISHNFSGKLIRKYDEILIMDGGRLMAYGSYDKLIQECDYFRKICEIKFGEMIR